MKLAKMNQGILLSYIYLITNIVCGLFLSSFLLTKLGDVEYGLYQTISSFANYLVLIQFGTGTVMTRNIAIAKCSGQKKELDRNFNTIFTISVALSICMIVVSIIFWANINNIYSNTLNIEQIRYVKKIFLVLVGYIVLSFLTQGFDGYLIGQENYMFTKIVSLIRIIIRTGCIVCIIYKCPFSIVIAFVDLGISAIIFIIEYEYCRKMYSLYFSVHLFSLDIFKTSAPLCLALFLQAITNQANGNVDKFVISVELDMTCVTIYSVAQYIFTMYYTILTIPITMYMPKIANYVSNWNKEKDITDVLVHPCRLSAFIGGFVLCGFVVIGQPFIRILYGASKIEAWMLALIIMIPTFVNMTDAVIIDVLDVKNMRLARSVTLLFTAIVNIILTVVLIKYIGMVGAVCATALTTIIGEIIIMNFYYSKALGINIIFLFKQAYRGIILPLIIAVIPCYFLQKHIENDMISLFVCGILFVLISGVIICFWGLEKEEKQKLASIMKKNEKEVY